MKSISIALLSLVLLNSCTKVEGYGGAATVSGTVTVKDYNTIGTLLSTYPAQDQDVFIIYGGDDNIQDDKTATSHDGTFEFRYLQKGTYKVYVYSKCVKCPTGQDSAVVATFEITDKKESVVLNEIIIRD